MPPPTSKPPDKNVDHDTPAPHPNLTWDDLGFRMHYKDLSKMVLVETEHVGETGPLLTHVHWKNAEIQVLPYAELTIDPCATALNYGQSIFEGAKAFRQSDGRIVVFRPELNARRFAEGARALSMAPVPPGLFLEAMQACVVANGHLVPPVGRGALYLRPVLLGTGAAVGGFFGGIL